MPRPTAADGATVLVANPSADLYGSDRMVLEAVRGLVQRSWRVVVTCSVAGPLVAPLTDAGAEVRILPVPVVRKSMLSPRGLVGLVAQAARSVRAMRRLIRDEGADVVLVNTVTLPLWLAVTRLLRVPSVLYVHEAESSLPRYARLLLTAPSVLATRVVYNSETSRLVSALPLRRDRNRVIHNGVRGPAVAVPARVRLDEPFRLVYVGRLSPRKGVDLVLRAAHELDRAGIATAVELVGSVFPGYEWYEAELRTLAAELGMSESVHFAGFQPAVWPFLERADVAVVPSRLDESFGNTVIEALLAARPVVVSDHTGLREAAAGFEAAVLTATDDVGQLSAALRRIHADWVGFRAGAERDAQAAADRYGPTRFHQELNSALDQILQ